MSCAESELSNRGAAKGRAKNCPEADALIRKKYRDGFGILRKVFFGQLWDSSEDSPALLQWVREKRNVEVLKGWKKALSFLTLSCFRRNWKS